MIRLLHTADWHLGHSLGEKDRLAEHQAFLDFLLERISAEAVDVLIHAGDVFHSPNPPNAALEQYYNFLVALSQTGCRAAVFVGGNHDSVSTLNAPANLLSALNVHVVGGVPEDPAAQLIPIRDKKEHLALVIAAVPFLRDRDLRRSQPGENLQERERQIREGISNHYGNLARLLDEKFGPEIPAVATGHLFAAGGSVGDGERDIHVGNLGKVGPESFSDRFCYVALGHLHRPQLVGGFAHIRYAGSPVPLTFEEALRPGGLVLADISEKGEIGTRTLEIPVFRALIRVEGDVATVKEALTAVRAPEEQMTPWVEVSLQLDAYNPEAAVQVQEAAEELPLDLLRIVARYPSGTSGLEADLPAQELSDLAPREVFLERCQSSGISEADQTHLLQTFDELLSWMDEQKSV